jgi:hypothetical protein
VSKKHKRPSQPAQVPAKVTTFDPEIIQQVVNWILEGHDRVSICRACRDQWPELDPVDLIIAAAQVIKANAAHSADLKSWSVEALKLLYKKQFEIGEFSAAARTLNQINEYNEAHTAPPPAPAAAPLASMDLADRGDIRLITRAVKSGWNIPPEAMATLPAAMLEIATTAKDPRVKIAATNALMAMNGQNIKSKPLRVRHRHTIEPINDANFADRRTALASRLAQFGANAGGTPAS